MPPRTTTRTPRAKVPISAVSAEPQFASSISTRPKKTIPILWVMAVLLLISVGIAGYFYYQYRQTSQAADKKEIEDLTQEIGSILLLPEGETPTLATVTDKEKLADQPFFQKAENGDKVLIFSNSGRAILYRPSAQKIVDVTTVNVNQPVTAPPAPAEAAPPEAPLIVRVALLNGSTTVGVTNKIENELKSILPNAAVVTKENAKKNDYTATTVVVLNSAAAQVAATMAQALEGSVGSLPEGEVAPSDADVVVIIGGSPQPAPETPEREN